MKDKKTIVGIPRSQALYMTCKACDAVRKVNQDCSNPGQCRFVIDIMGMWEHKGIIECSAETEADRALKEFNSTQPSEYTWEKLLSWTKSLAEGYAHIWRKLDTLESREYEEEIEEDIPEEDEESLDKENEDFYGSYAGPYGDSNI